MSNRTTVLMAALSLLAAIFASPHAAAEVLRDYVSASDPTFAYEVKEEVELGAGVKAWNVDLASQTWRGILWKHWVTILEPAEVEFPDAALLVISGGSNGKPAPKLTGESAIYLTMIASRMKCTVAVLSQVPNQPLFEGRREDALIAHTFDRFLESGEADWPLLLPMTKSAVRAMDLVQAFAREKFDRAIGRFCVTGGSKRGWTTWLTAACDPRVAAIAPMVIDTLNMKEQMPHQLRSWGSFTPEIHDYVELDLPTRMTKDARARELLDLVDPYNHRAKIGMPKLIVVGTNDPYWPIDATRFYFDELAGESYLHYVENAAHGLRPDVASHVSAFFRTVLAGLPRPRVAWRVVENAKEATLTAVSTTDPSAVRLWSATSDTRDFRESAWTSVAVEPNEFGLFVTRIPRPEKTGAHAAFYAELDFDVPGGGAFSVATRAEIVSGGVQ